MNVQNLMIHIVCVSFFAIYFSYPAKADEDPCEEYAQFYYAISVNRNILKFDLSNNGTTEPPHVDSVWITDTNDSIMQVYYDVQSGDEIDIVQSGDEIDIAFLPRGNYFLFIQMGDCIRGILFIARGTYPTDIDDILELHSQTISKFIRNGQLFIRRGDVIYTTDGRIVH